MAVQRFRGALAAASFPLVALLGGRTVGQPQLDEDAKTVQTALGTPTPTQMNTPQVLYCHNVMPTTEGMQSCGFVPKIAALAGANDFDQAITLRDANENNFIFVPARGKNYIFQASTGNWVSTDPFTGWNGQLVTRAYVNGRTFICYEQRGIYEYDAVAGTFTLQTITGLLNSEVRGIGASSNYLIAFTDLEVCWSSLVNPLDFVPDLTTGAGRSIPQDVKARITAVLGISGGFIVYTAKNAIAAVYTNNTRAPFTFKEIANAGGIQTYEQVTSEQTSGAQYAWTTGGFQKITVQSAEPVDAAVNDFIAGKMHDEFNPVTKLLTTIYSSQAEFPVKLSFISNRFVVLSYSSNNDSQLYDYALIYDVVLKRWGKVKVVHTDCFNYPYPNVFGNVPYSSLLNTTYDNLTQTTYADLATGVNSDPPSKLTIAFMSNKGAVQLLTMDYDKDSDQGGVIIFGHFQLIRAHMMTSSAVDFEGLYLPTADLPHPATCSIVARLPDNKGTIMKPMFLKSSSGKNCTYNKKVTGLNFDVVLEGTFALSTYVLEVIDIGSDR